MRDAVDSAQSGEVSKVRPDGRKSLLVYMDSELIKRLKKVALDRDVTAYSVVEDAVREWLDRNDQSGG